MQINYPELYHYTKKQLIKRVIGLIAIGFFFGTIVGSVTSVYAGYLIHTTQQEQIEQKNNKLMMQSANTDFNKLIVTNIQETIPTETATPMNTETPYPTFTPFMLDVNNVGYRVDFQIQKINDETMIGSFHDGAELMQCTCNREK